MRRIYVIEDEVHAECGPDTYSTFDAAMRELRRRADLAWDAPPNMAPCTSWRTCGRRYEIVEYDVSTNRWNELKRTAALQIDAHGVRWLCESSLHDPASPPLTAGEQDV